MITQLKKIAEDLRGTAAELTMMAAEAVPSEWPRSQGTLVDVARRLVEERRLIQSYMLGDLFCDPARDILLDLFIARAKGRPISVSSACIAAQVPATTALRYLLRLCDEGLIERVADQQDGRRVFVVLSGQGMQAMVNYLKAVRRVWCSATGKVISTVG